MKNILLFIALIFCFQSFAQRKPKIKGNKSVVDVSESLPPFNAIELIDDLEVRLQKSMDEGYAITADDNLIDILKFRVKDSTLIISSFYRITSKKKLDITINYNYINAITMRDGRIRMEDIITSDEFTVNTYENSKLELNANAPVMNINMEGNSSGDFNLSSEELNIILKDRIDVRIYSTSELNNIKLYKNATAKMEGTTDELNANLFENSNLKGERLEADKVLLTMQDSPSADVNARKDFELSASGSSKAYLYGDAKVTIVDFLDTSELHKKK